MQGYKAIAKLMRKLAAVIIVCGISQISLAQTIFLNSYKRDLQNTTNCVYKVDLGAALITDSLLLPTKGSFTSEAPIALMFGAHQFLISSLVSGLPAKNSEIRDRTYSYYFLINANNLNIIREDSLVNKMIAEVTKVHSDSISIDWIDEDDGGWNKSLYSINPPFRRLNHVRDRRYTENDFQSEYIGDYVGPKFICQIGDNRYYWGYQYVGDSSYINIIKVNSDTTIVGESRVGERGTANIVTGFSAFSNKIYSFITPYKLLSHFPISQSPENIHPQILIINPQDLGVEIEIEFQMGDAYAAQETGTVKSVGPFLYYYYFRQDGYGSFDPAYLLVFDTRTNEATWLRVGWR